MNFFGLGIWEIVFILLIVLVVVGPERLPRLARQLGLFVAQVQGWLQRSPDAQMIMQARRELEREISNLRTELVAMQQAQQQLVASAQQAINEPLAALKLAQEEITADLKSIGAAVEAESPPSATTPELTTSESEAAAPGAALDDNLASAAPADAAVDPAAAPGAALDDNLASAAPADAAVDTLPKDEALTAPELTPVPEPKAVPRSTRPFPAAANAEIDLPAPQLVELPAMPEPVLSEASSELVAAALNDEAAQVANLAEQAQAVALAGQFEELALRLQILASDLARLQQDLQRRGLLDTGLSAPQTSLPLMQVDTAETAQDTYAEAMASSNADKQL